MNVLERIMQGETFGEIFGESLPQSGGYATYEFNSKEDSRKFMETARKAFPPPTVSIVGMSTSGSELAWVQYTYDGDRPKLDKIAKKYGGTVK